MGEIDEIKKFVNDLDGWLFEKEGELLYHLAKNCTGKGVIVEIGSWKGKSTIWLGKGSKRGNKVPIYAIDPHTGSSEHKRMFSKKIYTFKEFKRNISKANVDDIIIPIIQTSEEAAKKFTQPIELIFIDGAHEYDLVKKDFELWFPKIIDGGIMAFHDTIWFSGPTRIVEEFVCPSKNFRNLKLINSITVAEKVGQNSFKDKIKNMAFTLLLIYQYNIIKNLKNKIYRYFPKPIKMILKRIYSLTFSII